MAVCFYCGYVVVVFVLYTRPLKVLICNLEDTREKKMEFLFVWIWENVVENL